MSLISRRSALGLGLGMALEAGSPKASAADTYPLWRIQQGRTKVYLCGNAGSTGPTWNSRRIEAALADSAVFWKETPDYTPADQQKYIRRGIDRAHPLSSWLTKEQEAKVEEAAKAAGIPYSTLEPMKPWLAWLALNQAFAKQPPKTPPTADPLAILQTKAVAAGKAVRSEFADGDATLAWIDGMNKEAMVEYLMFEIDSRAIPPAENERETAAWSRGDLSPMERRVRQMKAAYPSLYPFIEAGRNAEWPTRCQAMLDRGERSFVLAGAAHFVGPDSLLVYLQRVGLKPERI